MRLIGLDNLLVPQVTPEQAAAFSAGWKTSSGTTCDPCCTESNFRFDILGKPKSPWNKSAGRVFTTSFAKHYQISKPYFPGIIEAFHTRVKSLKADYKRHIQSVRQRSATSGASRRYQRKRKVSFLPN